MTAERAPTSDPGPRGRGIEFPVADLAAEVLANGVVNARYRRLVLSAGPPAVDAAPGQFFHLLCADEGPAFLRRPMSVFRADPAAGRVEFLYHVTGTGTAALAARRPGERLRIMGPLGHGFRLDPAWRHVLVLARGVGLATLAPVARWAARHGVSATAVLSARSREDLMDRIFAEDTGARILPVLDSDGSSEVGAVERLLARLIAADRPDAVFTCGSNRLLLLLQRLARTHGIPGQVALEQQMGCALGMCLCCVRPIRTADGLAYQRVCREGPVFDLLDAISW